jgi:hypothetical protein
MALKRTFAGSNSQVQCAGFWRRAGSGWLKLKSLFLRQGNLHFFRVCNSDIHALLKEKPPSLFVLP